MNIVLIVSGSIAAYKACQLASALVKAGHAVQAILTEAASKFIGPTTLEGLTGRRVYLDDRQPGDGLAHIELRRWADLYLLYPATANRINQLAVGNGADLAGATFLANNFQKPFWIAPAMNPAMLEHPATRQSLQTLEQWGCRLLLGDEGSMACGDYGLGRLMEPEIAFDRLQDQTYALLRKRLGNGRPRLLLTGGAMTEPIDAVRSIQNRSSGKTASSIAQAFLAGGWEVDYIHHESADLTGSAGANRQSYRSFADLSNQVQRQLTKHRYQAIVQAAAVSDYRPEPISGKLSSDSPVNLKLLPNPKLLESLRPWAAQNNSQPVICAFKLTTGQDEAAGSLAAKRLLGHQADLVVWNDSQTYTADCHPFVLWGAQNSLLARGQTGSQLAQAVFEQINQKAAPS